MKGVASLIVIVIIAIIFDSEAWLFRSSSRSGSRSLGSWGSRYSFPSRRFSFPTRSSRYTPSWSSSRYSPSWSSSRYTPSWSSSRYTPSWSSSRYTPSWSSSRYTPSWSSSRYTPSWSSSRYTPSWSSSRYSPSWSSSSSSSGSRSSSSRSPFPHDIKTKSGLTNLYNSRVVKVEKFEKPLSGLLGIFGLKHNGVVATTKDGGRWLIHKGPKFGKASDTIVVNAKHMSSQWKSAGAKSARDGTTIGGLVKAGLANKKWNLWNAKCWDATKCMMKKSGRRKRATY